MPKQHEAFRDPNVMELARHVVDYTQDARFQDLNDKEAYYKGTIYEKRPYDWQGRIFTDQGNPAWNVISSDMQPPMSLRRPSTPFHLGKVVVDRFVGLLFGEHRFPRIRVPISPATEEWFNALSKSCQMKAHFIEAATIGGHSGSVIVAFRVVDGKYQLEKFNTKWCNIIWDDYHSAKMAAFSIIYPFHKQMYDPEKKQIVSKRYLFRRVINKEYDITFQPQLLVDGAEVKLKNPDEPLVIDEERTHAHGLDFCPAVFIQNIPRYDEVDGEPTCEGAYDMIDRLNECLSAVHAAILANLDPTLLLKMTPEDYKKLQTMGGVVQTGANGQCLVVGDKGDGKFLEITGDGIKITMETVEKIRTAILDLTQCVIADPHRITGAAQSAAAIMKLYAPMLTKADVLRNSYGENGIKRLLSMMLEAYHQLGGLKKTEKGIVKRVMAIFRRLNPKTRTIEQLAPEKDITLEDIALDWGDYFEPTTADVFQAIEAGVMATGGKAITTVEKAAKFAARYLDDHDVATTIQDLQKQDQEDKDHEMQLIKLGQAAKAKAPNPGGSRPRTPAQPDN